MEKTYIITDSELQSLLEKQFLNGFKISGEGYNWEYPFEGNTNEAIWKSISQYSIAPDLSHLKEAPKDR
jgi:hypothetical protein